MRTCKNCGASLDDDALFCTSCGTKNEPEPLSKRQCPHCGAPMDDDALFCTACGQRAEQPRINVEEKPYPTDEREPVTPTETYDIEEEDSQNKWIWLGGIAAIIILIGGWLLFKNFQGHGKDESVFPVKEVPFKKFVKVIDRNAVLRKSPNMQSAQLVYQEDICDYIPEWKKGPLKRGYKLVKAEILPVWGEEGDWLKAQCNNKVVYIKKQSCQEVSQRPLPQDCEGFKVLTSGKYEGCCFQLQESEGTALDFNIGRYVDGMYVFNYHLWAYADEEGTTFIDDGSTIHFNKQKYADESGYPDLQKIIADEAVLDLIANSIDKAHSWTTVYYGVEGDENIHYVSIEASEVADDVDQTITGYSVLVKDETNFTLMAEMNSELVSTGFETTANSLEVTETGDFDGDGSLDALIFESQGGTAGSEQSYLVFYSQDDGTFHSIEAPNSIRKEEWKGKTSFVENAGITFIRYVLEDGELKKVENKTADVGKTIWKRTREELFPVADEASEDKEVWFDIDGDGEDEMLVFSHDCSHANNFGQDMELSRISWSDGHVIERDALPFGGETFVFLNQSTNGMHDMLIDNSALFRWSGNQYEYWQFDGKKLTPK